MASRPASAPPVLDRLLDVAEAASLLGISPKTAYQWAAERRLPRVRLGTGEKAPVRFRLSSLIKLMEQLEEPALRAAWGTELTSPRDSRKSAPGGGHV